MTATALFMLVVCVLSFNRAHRFNAEVVARRGALVVLRIWGLRMAIHQDSPFPETQTIYLSNHTSSLDVFVLVALGLPNTRFFLKRYVRKHLPIGVVAHLMGTFFTIPQEYQEQRRKMFAAACNTLRLSRESVYLSPEGKITLSGEIGPFNKGAFHLATVLRAPIVPLYIRIPPESDCRDGLYVPTGGMIDVFVLEPIPTAEWVMQELERNRDDVRSQMIEFHRKFGSGGSDRESEIRRIARG